MSSLATAPSFGGYHSLRRFSVDEYHRMIQTGILDETDRVELLDGYLVLKKPRNPPHHSTIQRVQKRIFRLLPTGWDVRIQCAVTLLQSEPEPDLAVVRGDDSLYQVRHSGPGDVGLILEVADSSLDRDRNDKGRIYAHAGIPCYWIVNLIDSRVEVFTTPSGPSAVPVYGQRQDYAPGSSVPLSLDTAVVASIPVADLLP